MPQTFGARYRPLVVPSSLDELDGPTERGVVTLPTHLAWSGHRTYDLDDDHERRRVYEIVLREGDRHDQLRFIDVDHLTNDFPLLFLPEAIEVAWRILLDQRAEPRSC